MNTEQKLRYLADLAVSGERNIPVVVRIITDVGEYEEKTTAVGVGNYFVIEQSEFKFINRHDSTVTLLGIFVSVGRCTLDYAKPQIGAWADVDPGDVRVVTLKTAMLRNCG